jgi:hypothetical protein
LIPDEQIFKQEYDPVFPERFPRKKAFVTLGVASLVWLLSFFDLTALYIFVKQFVNDRDKISQHQS